jgi:hypothetical protein
LWEAVREVVARGVWRPELHGAYHYDPQRRRQAVASSTTARRAAAQGILPFPGSAQAWELGPWRPREVLATELGRSLKVFADHFGFAPVSVIAPDYTWDSRCEELWEDGGLYVVQAKREQRHPRYRGGFLPRLRKVIGRAWDRLTHPRLTYLERNCRFEPVQAASSADLVTGCRQQVRRAWRQGEPAIVETHRINFVHVDSQVAEIGFQALGELLNRLAPSDPQGGDCLFLVDAELAQLYRTGTSVCARGPYLVLRNLTHSRRLLVVPSPSTFASPTNDSQPQPTGTPRMVLVEPQTVILWPLDL